MVKVTIEMDGEKKVMEGDFVSGFVGCKFEDGCVTRAFLTGDAPTVHLPQCLAETACKILTNYMEEDILFGCALLVQFQKQVEKNVENKMAEDADVIASGISEFLKSSK